MIKSIKGFVRCFAALSVVFLFSFFSVSSLAPKAFADDLAPTTPTGVSVWAVGSTFSITWNEPNFKATETFSNHLGYNISWQLFSADGTLLEPAGGAQLRNFEGPFQQQFASRVMTYSGSFPAGSKLEVKVQACNRSCQSEAYNSGWSSQASATISNPNPSGPGLPPLHPGDTTTYTPVITNPVDSKPSHCAPQSITPELANPVKFDDENSYDFEASATVNGVLITPAQEHEVVCLNDTWGMSFHSDGIYLPVEYSNHQLHAFIYSEPKYVGSGIVDANGHLSLPDIDKFKGPHAIALYDDDGAIVAKEDIIVGENPIVNTAGESLPALILAFLLLGLVVSASVGLNFNLNHGYIAKHVK